MQLEKPYKLCGDSTETKELYNCLLLIVNIYYLTVTRNVKVKEANKYKNIQ